VPLAFHSGREADHSPPPNAEVKEWLELYLHSPNTPFSARSAWNERIMGMSHLAIRRRVYPKVSGLAPAGARTANGTALCH
jgi:hypothetical protein